MSLAHQYALWPVLVLPLALCAIPAVSSRAGEEAPARKTKTRQTAPALPQKHVDFRKPRRVYRTVPMGDTTIRVEAQLLDDEPKVAERAIARLGRKRAEALAALPERHRARLKALRLYLMYGPRSTHGGRDNGLEYFQSNAAAYHPELDPHWGSAIVVYCAENYTRISELWALKALVHEFAHAYQLEQWPEDQPDIYDAWDHARRHKLYRRVRNDKGRRLETAYAIRNHLEYFAELSCLYFVGADYEPFDRQGLKMYDPRGYAMIRKMWKIED